MLLEQSEARGLAASSPAKDPATASSPPRASPQQPGARILVVDDELGIQRMLSRLLRPHQVVCASSGEQAQRLLGQDAAFDLVLCDVMMPELTGIELHRWLAGHHPALAGRLVFLSGGVFSEDSRRYLESVSCPRIGKPFEPDLVREVVGTALSRRRAGDQAPRDSLARSAEGGPRP